MHSSGSLRAHPLLSRVGELFAPNPPPVEVWEGFYSDRGPYDIGCGRAELLRLLAIRWGEFEKTRDFACFVDDLTYGTCQQDVFNFLFPGFLVFWWQCLRSRSDYGYFYTANYKGRVYEQMIQEEARSGFLDWVVRAFVDAIDEWSGQLSSTSMAGTIEDPRNNLDGLLSDFNSLGQTLPVIEGIWERLCHVETVGRAQWWLVLATGLAYTPNTCPFIRPYSRQAGGGGVVLHSSRLIGPEIPYLPTNLEFIRSHLTIDVISHMLNLSTPHLRLTKHRAWIQDITDRICDNREFCDSRLRALLERLGEARLGLRPGDRYPDVVS